LAGVGGTNVRRSARRPTTAGCSFPTPSQRQSADVVERDGARDEEAGRSAKRVHSTREGPCGRDRGHGWLGKRGRTTLADARRKGGYVRQDKRPCCLMDLLIYCTRAGMQMWVRLGRRWLVLMAEGGTVCEQNARGVLPKEKKAGASLRNKKIRVEKRIH
jgi:hypothetical protein